MYGYVANVATVVNALEELLDSGQASEVISLSEYALECVEDAIGRVDDSDGGMGEIKERACRHSPPSLPRGPTRPGGAGRATLRLGDPLGMGDLP